MPIYLPEIWYSIGKLHLTINLLVHIQLVGHEFSLSRNGLDDEWNLTKSVGMLHVCLFKHQL